MRKLLLFAVLVAVSFSVAAQQQASPAPKKDALPPAAAQKGNPESDSQWRERTEGVVSGVRPVPEREIEGVGAGAKPHMHFDQLDRGLHRRSQAEVITPPSK